MSTARGEVRARWNDPPSFEVLGRVLTVLCDSPGPLAECLGFRLWPLVAGHGYVLTWCGVAPTEADVVEYLSEAAADDDMTTVLRPGDVRFTTGNGYTLADVRGVRFQLRTEPMVQPETFTAMGKYWRTGELAGHG
ncbi:hypothetical protein IU510_29655 [Nocardia cyriacigeorgica]|uniref:hypothetical protein n=1 Tax=Nocardia cyriacigeorgica TaxID=135487 RepID=UPI001894E8CD|nr:hypothetical protein [Nocardia cyriacigeorgica]MBF6102186.1 hypothetical protein [Nocardia cyriacigeorgica]